MAIANLAVLTSVWQRLLLVALLTAASLPLRAAVMDDVLQLQQKWEVIKYQTAEEKQADAYAALATEAEAVVKAYPGRAEPLIWRGIILASNAGAEGGLSALPLVDQAKALFEQALAIDSNALNGSALTSLGSLYYQVPGWPLSFGDDDKARELLTKALAVNPDGIDSNYWLGAFLYDQGEYQAAKAALEKAKLAPPRPGRVLADAGRQQEIRELLAKVNEELAP